MNDNIILSFLIILLPIFGAIVGSFITNWLEKNKQINFENIKLKREIYKKFVIIVVDILQDSKNHKKTNRQLTTKKLYDFYNDYILYSSPAVINAFSDYMQYIFTHDEDIHAKSMFYKLSKILACMRKDIGLSNFKLGKDGINIFRAMFKDFDAIK